MVDRRKLDLEETRTWLGVPFQHLGRSRRGIDCIGLVVVNARASGFAVQDRDAYPREPTGELIEELERQAIRIPIPWLESGDLLVFRMPVRPRHVAIWTGETIIHAAAMNGKVEEHPIDFKWRRRLHSAWRLA